MLLVWNSNGWHWVDDKGCQYPIGPIDHSTEVNVIRNGQTATIILPESRVSVPAEVVCHGWGESIDGKTLLEILDEGKIYDRGFHPITPEIGY